MKIKDVIECLKDEGTWVRWNRCTRDRVLFGDDDQEVKKIGVCWVATNKVIEQALEKGINFIISHSSLLLFFQHTAFRYGTARRFTY